MSSAPAVVGRSAGVAALRALPEAVASLAAALLTLACAQAIAPGPGSAVLAVVLCLSLSRSRLDRDWRGRLEAAVALPLVGLAATGVGLLLRDMPWLGAMAFTACLASSVWLRQFGELARRAGRLIALPFVAVLTVPHVSGAQHGVLPAWLVPVAVALLALAWVSAVDALGRRLGVLADAARWVRSGTPVRAAAAGMRPSATTRMALQMGLALAAAFAAGHAVFGRHWPWVVLTTFIVHSRNRGRLDVAYTSLLRTAGAAGGTLAATALASTGIHAGGGGGLILAAVFLGTWLRPLNYAWWALFATLALALLQNYAGLPATSDMLLRLAAIATGAAIGVAAAWWVLPVRSADVLRRRLADALAALGEALDPAIDERTPVRFEQAVSAVEQLAPPFRMARRIAPSSSRDAAGWIDAMTTCREPALALIADGSTPGGVRRAVVTARQALREPARLLGALEALLESLRDAAAPSLALPRDA